MFLKKVMKEKEIRNVVVLIIGDYQSQYGSINFTSVEELNELTEQCIEEFGIGCTTVFIEDTSEFSEEELNYLEENDFEF